MITWDKDHAGRFLGADWSNCAASSGLYEASFPLEGTRGELRVDVAKGEVELIVRSETRAKIASWLYACDRVDVHDDLDETACVTFWPARRENEGVNWLGIYRLKNRFSVFTGSMRPLITPTAVPDAENVGVA